MRRNVAGQFVGAQMITAADGTAFTGSVTVSVTGDAGTQAAGSVGAGACAHEGNGFHTYAPAQAETNYTHVAYTFTGTGAIPTTVQVYPVSYDASGRFDVGSFGGTAGTFASGRPEVNTTHLAGQSVTAAAGVTFPTAVASPTNITAGTITTVTTLTNLPTIPNNWLTAAGINTGAFTAAKFAAGAIDAAAVAADAWEELIEKLFTYNATADYASAAAGSAVKEIADNAGGSPPSAAAIADAVWDEAIAGHASAGSTGEALSAAGAAGDPWITTLPGSYTSGQAGHTIGTYIDAAITSRLASSSNGSGLSAIPWNAAWDAEVQSEVDDALVAQNLDHLVKSAVDTNFATTVHLDSVIGHLADNGTTATFDRTTDSVEALRDRGDAAWATATGFSTHSAADVWSAGTRTLTALDEDSTTLDLDATIRAAVGLAAANMDTQFGAVTLADGSLTAAKIASSAFTAAKFASGAIDAAAIATDAAQEIRDSVWGKVIAELTGDPTATPTAADCIMLPFMGIRNKRDTDSGLGTDEIHNSAGSVILTAAITDAAGVFSKAKYA